MIKGQKSARGGIEDFLCPFENFYITCGPNESKYHMGIMAIDVRGSEVGLKEAYYAPCTVKCIKTYQESGQVMWQSVDKVRCSNGYIGYVTFMTVHDDTMNAYPGLIIPQGNQLGNMGVKGNATGVHCHIECSQGADTTWFKNSYGNYMFNNEIDPEDVFFMDNTNIINGVGNWKYLKDVPVEEDNKKQDSSIELLERAVAEKEDIINNLTDDVTELTNTIVNKDEEIKKLKEQLAKVPKKIYECTKEDYYAIKLHENQKLYLG